jgi:GNAT superfamily N-acetyltransferase
MVEIVKNDESTIIQKNKKEQRIAINIYINEFDTQHFGIVMATLNWDQTENINFFKINEIQELFDKCVKYCISKNIKHAALKANTKNYKIIHVAESYGFNLVNVSVEYAFDYKKQAINSLKNLCKIRNANPNDLVTVLDISKNIFKDFSRFHYDQFLDDRKADDLYQVWIRKSFLGYADEIIISEYNSEIIGFCTIKDNFTTIKGENAAGVILTGVAEKARGLGIYKSMINEAIIRCSKLENTRYIASSTQAQNIFGQRAWSDLGFKIYNCVYIFHKILGEM